MSSEERICVRCQRPVVVNASRYEVLERMHWLCFHLEFEHQSDPDEPCSDPSCPWRHIEIYRRMLNEMGQDAQQIIEQAIKERWG